MKYLKMSSFAIMALLLSGPALAKKIYVQNKLNPPEDMLVLVHFADLPANATYKCNDAFTKKFFGARINDCQDIVVSPGQTEVLNNIDFMYVSKIQVITNPQNQPASVTPYKAPDDCLDRIVAYLLTNGGAIVALENDGSKPADFFCGSPSYDGQNP